MVRDGKTKVSGQPNEKGFLMAPSLSKGEQETVTALERSISKKAFDVGIRCMYITKNELYSPPFGVGGFVGSFGQFGTEGSNAIKPDGDKWHHSLGDPWKDFRNMRRNRFARIVLALYKRRAYFYTPYVGTPMVLNTEELATIYHFPGSVAQTPTLDRVASKKSQAPSNLPI